MPPKSSKQSTAPPPLALSTARITRKQRVLFDEDDASVMSGRSASRSSVQRAPSASSIISGVGGVTLANSSQQLFAGSLSETLLTPTAAKPALTKKGSKATKSSMPAPTPIAPTVRIIDTATPQWVAQLQTPAVAAEVLPSVVPSPLPFLRRMADLRMLRELFPSPTLNGDSASGTPKLVVTVIDEDLARMDEDAPEDAINYSTTTGSKRPRDYSPVTILSPSGSIAALEKARVGQGVYATALLSVWEAANLHASKALAEKGFSSPHFNEREVELLAACHSSFAAAMRPLDEAANGRPALAVNALGPIALSHPSNSFLSFAYVMTAVDKVLALDHLLRRCNCQANSDTYQFDAYFRVPSSSAISSTAAKSFLRSHQAPVRVGPSLESLWEASWRLWVANAISRSHVDKHWLVRGRAHYVRHTEGSGSRSVAHHLAILGIAASLAADTLGGMKGSSLAPQCAMLLSPSGNGDQIYTIPTASGGVPSPTISAPSYPSHPLQDTQAEMEYRHRATIMQHDVYHITDCVYTNAFSSIRNAATAAHGPSRTLLAEIFESASKCLGETKYEGFAKPVVAAIHKMAETQAKRIGSASIMLLSDDTLSQGLISNGRRELAKMLLLHAEEEDGLPRYMRYVHRLQQQQNQSGTQPPKPACSISSVEGLFPTPLDLPISHFPLLSDPLSVFSATTFPVSSPSTPDATASWATYECGLQDEIVGWFREYLWGAGPTTGRRRKTIYPVLLVAPSLVATRLLMGHGTTLLATICEELKHTIIRSPAQPSAIVPLWKQALAGCAVTSNVPQGFHTVVGIDKLVASLVAGSGDAALHPVEAARRELVEMRYNLRSTNTSTEGSALHGIVVFYHNFTSDEGLAYYPACVIEMS